MNKGKENGKVKNISRESRPHQIKIKQSKIKIPKTSPLQLRKEKIRNENCTKPTHYKNKKGTNR